MRVRQDVGVAVKLLLLLLLVAWWYHVGRDCKEKVPSDLGGSHIKVDTRQVADETSIGRGCCGGTRRGLSAAPFRFAAGRAGRDVVAKLLGQVLYTATRRASRDFGLTLRLLVLAFIFAALHVRVDVGH